MARTAIVVPCYNEAARLDMNAFKRFALSQCETDFIFVNDGSTDATGQLLDDFCAAIPERLLVRHLARNGGKAEAVRHGVLFAFDKGYEYIGYWDADLSTPLRIVSEFCAALDSRPDIEVVFARRVCRRVDKESVAYLIRRRLGGLFPRLARAVLGVDVHDTQCGAKLFRVTETLPRLFDKPFIAGWMFDVEILARLAQDRRGRPVAQPMDVLYEFPIECWRDMPGSKRVLTDYVRSLWDMLSIYRKYRE